VRQHSAQLLQQRFDNGLETMGSLRQAQSREATASADLSAARQAIAQQKLSIAALMGAGPDRGMSLRRPAASLLHPQGLPATLQADLLGRRPDLAAARLRAEAAASRINVARAAFYPNVNLSAYLGVQSLGLSYLTKNGSDIGGVGPAISLPIFRGGALQGNYRVARAEYDAAVASYNQTLTQALHEVADVMAQQQELGPQLEQRRLALKTAEESYQVMQNRYQGGLASYLDVLNAEDNVIASRRSSTSLETRLFLLDVNLIKPWAAVISKPEPHRIQQLQRTIMSENIQALPASDAPHSDSLRLAKRKKLFALLGSVVALGALAPALLDPGGLPPCQHRQCLCCR
jgi:NodT family efflux transporter outer membrane factor (OMF) lipoprotein